MRPMERVDLILSGIGELATPEGRLPRPGASADRIAVEHGRAIAVRGGRIVAVGEEAGILRRFTGPRKDAGGRLVTPGLVDPHTHAVFVGDRSAEFDARLRGATYRQIAEAGGGIRATVRAVREASDDRLRSETALRLSRMLAHGATTVEVKSGYGLTAPQEVRLLEVARDAAKFPAAPRVVPTFLGAHEVPDEFRADRDGYVRLVREEMIPRVARGGLARFCDVFCEEGVFDVEQTRSILLAARAAGLGLKIHAEEFAVTGGARLAADLGATSADHLLAVDRDGIAALAGAGVVAVLLPGTSYTLRRAGAAARDLLAEGVTVAVGTDCNPGSSPTESMGLMLSMACCLRGLTPAEALTACTLNAAAAVGMADRIGSLDEGKEADWVMWDASSYTELPTRFGTNLVAAVGKGGKVVW
ncbi:MAG: imidazolonepropionase, partial [Planctomycetes bacterium]|nr:imidazolonepropionase [Planctomycetota bacterium]